MEDRAAFAGTEIPGADTGVVGPEVLESHEVAVGEVEDVDVVADGGAVFGFVVWYYVKKVRWGYKETALQSWLTVAKDQEFFSLTHCYLR